jgi:hypothetical protein
MERIVAIDPLALLLRHDIYVRLTLPDPPPPEVLKAGIREAINKMSVEERRVTAVRAKALAQYAATIEKELTEVK